MIVHYYRPFENLQCRLKHSNNKKLNWLIHNKNLIRINSSKAIRFFSIINNNNFNNVKYVRNKPIGNPDNNTIETFIEPSEFSNRSFDPLEQTNDKWFVNLSNMDIPQDVTKLLQFGNNFCLPNSLNKKKTIHEFIKDIEGNTKRNNINNLPRVRNAVIPQLHNYLYSKPTTNNVNTKLLTMYKITQRFCKNNPDIIFTRADKGNITVAMNKEYYIQKTENMLQDKNTYTILKKNPAKQIENDCNNLLKSWFKKEYISKKEYFRMHSSDAPLPKAYALPKIHKPNHPFRIIVSSIDTALYPLASFLQKIISDNIPKTRSYVNNSFDLYSTLSGMKVSNSNILISLDATSLFTNIPLNLALESIKKRWSHIREGTNIPKKEFLIAIELILSSTYFNFNNAIYKQTFGTPMGSPLSPIIADMVMQDLEETILESIGFNLPFYFRYVDDIIMSIPRDKAQYILDKFNNYHDRLKFTIEYENDRTLSFLDLKLHIINDTIHIDWYHKDTFSGRYLSYYSNHPECHKIGTIYSLVDRSILLSHPIFQAKNIKLCINILMNNGYPIDLIFMRINIRLRTLFDGKLKQNKNANRVDTNVDVDNDSEENRRKIIVIPFINNISEKTAHLFDKKEHIIGYRVLNKLDKFIKTHKDTNALCSNNNVIYKIKCNDCDASYVGQTKRQLKTRINEHKNNYKLDPSRHSVITEHILNLNHSFNWNNPEILDFETNYYKRLISEMIHIKEQKNGINSNKDTELLDGSYFNILNELSNNS
ncbi:uncharacterized protein LOC143903487 [Temnothorax americanus]|uniref:uncharacterized protein LOC143903487 n=1 Tax=Temnothorax americanus TaxID=1964332 RepID=UPI0040693994